MKTYKKLHESKQAANAHIAKIKQRGGDVKQSVLNGKILLEYSFVDNRDEKLYWEGYDILKDEYLVIPEKELDEYPNVTWTSGVSDYNQAKKLVDKYNAEHKKRFIKEGNTYRVRGYNYDGKEVAKIEKIIITNRVYVKFYNNPKSYNYEVLEFKPIK